MSRGTEISDTEVVFTFTERMKYARKKEEVERMKAEERMKSGKKSDDPVENLPQGQNKTRDKVAAETGFGSGKQYEKAKYIDENVDKLGEEGLREKTPEVGWNLIKQLITIKSGKLHEKDFLGRKK